MLWSIGSLLLLLFYLLPFSGAAYAIALRLIPSGRVSVRLLAASVTLTGLLLGAVKAALLAHIFTRWGFAAMSGVVWLALLMEARRHPFLPFLAQDCSRSVCALRGLFAAPAGLLLWPGALLICFTFTRALLTPPLSWDSLSYHMVLSGRFVQEGGDFKFEVPQTSATISSYPRDFERLTALVMLPFHADTAANGVHLPFWLMGLLAVHVLGGTLGLERRRLRVGLALWTFTPAFFAYLPSQYVEPAVLALILAGVALACRFFEDRGFPAAALGILAFSLAFDMKPHALGPWMLGVGAILLFGIRHGAWSWRRWVLAGCLVAVGLPFALDGMLKHGNPFYPFPTRFLGFRMGEAHPSLEHYLKEADRFEQQWAAEHKAPSAIARLAPYLYSFRQVFSNSHITLGTASLLVTLFGIFGLRRIRNRWILALLLLNLLAAWALFFAPSMEGLRLLFSLSYSRLLTFPNTLGLMLGLLAFPGFRIVDALYWILAFTQMAFAVQECWIPQDFYILAPAALVFGLLAASLYFRSRMGLAVLAGLLVAGMPLIQQTRDSWRYTYLAQAYDVSPIGTRAVPLYPLLDVPPASLRIAVAFGEPKLHGNWCFIYPLMGRRLQNRIVYVPPTHSGRIVDYELLETSGETLDEAAWLARLDASGAQALVLSIPWTPEMAWVRARPKRFQKVAESEGLVLFRILPEAVAP